MKYLLFSLKALLLFCTLMSCSNSDQSGSRESEEVTGSDIITVPEWSKNANIYELNIRQFTPEGTFSAIEPHLGRLREMGVDIIWFMPIHPISETKRKGTLGSYYAVDGFREVNPEYGTLEDFKALLAAAHTKGLKVLIDWVPHHTGWDHPWITEHPDWYSQDDEGNIIDPINEETGEPWGWTDVAELDLSNQDMRAEIISDMIYWLEDVGVDGFRVDHAHGLPADYWKQVGSALAATGKPIFMLAEGEEPYLRNGKTFTMTYAWHFHHAMNDIASGKKTVDVLDTILADERDNYNYGYNMYFTSNHDENSWAGTVMERMGEGHKAFAVLAHTIDGMPLIYSGQEAPMTKRLEFFEKDPINWMDYSYAPFYTTLNNLKHNNRALWNGEAGGISQRINESESVYAFKRQKDDDEVVVILNLTPEPASTTLSIDINDLTEVFGGEVISVPSGQTIDLEPWQYMVLSNTM